MKQTRLMDCARNHCSTNAMKSSVRIHTVLVPALLVLISLVSVEGMIASDMEILESFQPMSAMKRKVEEIDWTKVDPKCSIYKNEQLHAIMDRVCELCHEMYSHVQPNLRSECRQKCFRNKKFQRCLSLFSPAPEKR